MKRARSPPRQRRFLAARSRVPREDAQVHRSSRNLQLRWNLSAKRIANSDPRWIPSKSYVNVQEKRKKERKKKTKEIKANSPREDARAFSTQSDAASNRCVSYIVRKNWTCRISQRFAGTC